MSRVGERLKETRIKQGLSQKQLAKKIGAAENFINDIELGRKVIPEAIIDKLSKALGENLNDMTMYNDEAEEKASEAKRPQKSYPNFSSPKAKKEEAPDAAWSSAFGSILRSIPVFDYNMNKPLATKEFPIKANKINGYSQDKVFMLQIEDDEMLGYRIAKGDLAFCHVENEIQNNKLYFVEYKGERMVRQVKKLDNTKILLISNMKAQNIETAIVKEVKLLGQLDYIELKL
ncbi:helix-turn-helix domain-containing protein [Clostridium cellulovorans]|uniref:Helix-turn-helix domain protein n=1 Tax=Clostridium cellulovorans (strain ATCC 35296 / DSM 3052 / OCM 3 / 743B) TaxID=573061 RepID=D9SKW3_CLOC7|nr:LexA family transcriptional regulator [Clostridium cellulovorans]ADL53535.1 helix-turn-helix domain protein [Clostridium cellulovorans 743B]